MGKAEPLMKGDGGGVRLDNQGIGPVRVGAGEHLKQSAIKASCDALSRYFGGHKDRSLDGALISLSRIERRGIGKTTNHLVAFDGDKHGIAAGFGAISQPFKALSFGIFVGFECRRTARYIGVIDGVYPICIAGPRGTKGNPVQDEGAGPSASASFGGLGGARSERKTAGSASGKSSAIRPGPAA